MPNYDKDLLIEKINSIQTADSDSNFIFVISNLKFEDGWFSQILDDNKVIMSYKDIVETLQKNSIPIENAVISLLYSYAFLYKKYSHIPNKTEEKEFMHIDTRGCIFDLSSTEDIIYSCTSPIICAECSNKLNNSIDNNFVETIKKECKRIKKTLINRIFSIIQQNPLVSACFAIALPISLSLLTSNLLEKLPIGYQIFIMFSPIAILIILWFICMHKARKR